MSGVGKSSGPGAATSSGIVEEPQEGTTTATAEESAAATESDPVDTAERTRNEREALPPGVRDAFQGFSPGFDWRRGPLIVGSRSQADLPLTQNFYETTFDAEDRAAINEILAKGSNVTSHDLNDLATIVGHVGDPATALSALYWKFNWVDNHQGIETWSALDNLANQSGVCRDTANFNTYVLSQKDINAKTFSYAESGGIAHAVTLYEDPERRKWTLLEYTRGGHTDDSVYFDTMEAAAGALLAAWKGWEYDNPTSGSQRPAAAAGTFWTRHGRELDGYFVNRNVLRPGDRSRDGWYGNVSDRSTTLSADFGKFSFDLRHYHQGVMPQIGGSFFVAGRYGDQEADGWSGGSISLFAGHMPNTWSRTIGPRKAVETSTTVFGVGFERRGQLLDFGLTPSDRLRLTSLYDTSGAAVGAIDHRMGGFDKGVAAGLSYWDVSLRNQLTYEATKNVDLWLSHTTHVPLAETVVRLADGGDLRDGPISHFAEVGGRVRVGSFTNETALYVPISIHNNLFHDDLRLNNTLDLRLSDGTHAVLEAYGDVDGFDTWGANLGVRHGNVLATVGYADDEGQDRFTFKLGVDF